MEIDTHLFQKGSMPEEETAGWGLFFVQT